MKMNGNWQCIAERLAESGWTWKHFRIIDRLGRARHVARVCNSDGQKHIAVAPEVRRAFAAVAHSIKTMETSG